MTPTPPDRPPKADIDTSPTLLLAGLFSARRSGDGVLARIYLRRLADIGIAVSFAPIGPPAPDTDAPRAPVTA